MLVPCLSEIQCNVRLNGEKDLPVGDWQFQISMGEVKKNL